MSRKTPWIFVVLAFLLLIGAWAALITIAKRNAPQQIDPTQYIQP
ncbi:MAG: hypothetical protein RLZ97_1264 [Verrucomicrobiota bacterium]|jgi:hypothetical protein